MSRLTFDEVTEANVARCDRWHKGGLGDWSVPDWAVAMAGEAGEVCNAVKKLRRVEDDIANINDPDRQISTRKDAVEKIGEELADTFLYLNLLAVRLGLHLPTEIVKKFNATSERYGFPERLPRPFPYGSGAPSSPTIPEMGMRERDIAERLRAESQYARSRGHHGRAMLLEAALAEITRLREALARIPVMEVER